MANPRSIAMAKIREREALARQAAMLNSGSNTTPVANPIQYSNAGMYEGVTSDDVGMTLPKRNKKGAMLSQITGALQGIVSDDDNDLDDVNFSLADGLKVSLKNNRGKDKNPKVRYSDLGQYEGVTSDDLAGFQMGEDQMAMQDVQALPDAKDDAKRFSALNSFIEENSAGPKPAPEGSHYMPDGTLMSDADMGQYNQSGQSMDGNNSLEIGNELNPIPEQAPLDQIVSEYDQQLLGEQVSGQYAGDKGIDLGYAGDGNRGIELDPLDYQGSEGRYDGVTSDDLASTPEQFAAENPEFEALDQVVSDFELANPELVTQQRNELKAEELSEEQKYIEDFALENPELATHLLENPELVNELEDGEALYDGLVKLNDENLTEGQFEGVTSDDLATTLEQQFDEEVLVEEQDTKEAYIQLSNSMAPEDLADLDGKLADINKNANVDGQEVTESKLSDLFGSLKDIFGVDNKSLLRAAIKYIGGRVFGLSSGKAAQFAWAGIEADMATNAAAGADAKAFQANMDEYDKQYDAAMAAKNPEEANRILQKMNSLSGVEKSDAEKFDDNITYLNSKYTEAEKAGDKVKMSQIAKQLKAMEDAGISGTASDPWYGNISMEDANGAKIVRQGKQTPNGLMFLDSEDGKWKFPRDEGFSNTKRTVKSDENENRYATDTRTNIDPEDVGTYQTDIIGAISVTAGGSPNFGETGETKVKNANFSKSAVAAYMQMEDMVMHSEEARREIFALDQAFRNEVGAQEAGPIKGFVNKFIKRDMSPIAKMWYNNMNTLITSKLRVETGAAYNKDELMNTMSFFPNTADYPSQADYEALDEKGKEMALLNLKGRMKTSRNWMIDNAGGLKSKGYLEGLLSGVYRPDDNWLEVNAINKQLMDYRFNPQLDADLVDLIEEGS